MWRRVARQRARERAIHTQTDMIYTIELLIYGLIVKCNNFPIYTDIVFEWKKQRTQRQTAKLSVCVSFFLLSSGFVRRLLHTMLPCRCFNLKNKFSSAPLFLAFSSSVLFVCFRRRLTRTMYESSFFFCSVRHIASSWRFAVEHPVSITTERRPLRMDGN